MRASSFVGSAALMLTSTWPTDVGVLVRLVSILSEVPSRSVTESSLPAENAIPRLSRRVLRRVLLPMKLISSPVAVAAAILTPFKPRSAAVRPSPNSSTIKLEVVCPVRSVSTIRSPLVLAETRMPEALLIALRTSSVLAAKRRSTSRLAPVRSVIRIFPRAMPEPPRKSSTEELPSTKPPVRTTSSPL